MFTFFIVLIPVLSLPYWLPGLFIKIRVFVFTRINGAKGIHLPEASAHHHFKACYEHQKLRGKSQGAELSDLFWYWLSPGASIHLEHLEDGERYDKLLAFTKEKLSLSRSSIEAMLTAEFKQLQGSSLGKPYQIIRFRDIMIPFWASFYYQLIFKEPCPPMAKAFIANHASNVVNAMKCYRLRNMKTRAALTDFLTAKLKKTPYDFPAGFSIEEQALFLQGTFFTTAIVQMSDAMCHLIMVLAKNPSVQSPIRDNKDDKSAMMHVINETLRLFPLFGIAHRICLDDILVNDKLIQKGSVVCFDYQAYQRIGIDNPDDFQPKRWEHCPVPNFIPFGVKENRMCPAQGIALISMRKLLQLCLEQYHFESSASQTRAMVNRAPMLIKTNQQKIGKIKNYLLLLTMRVVDRWERVYISLIQLFYGIWMVREAKQLKICSRYFDSI